MVKVQRLRRSPRGTLAEKPLYVGLSDDERDALEVLSVKLNCSLSRTARELIRLGLRNLPSGR